MEETPKRTFLNLLGTEVSRHESGKAESLGKLRCEIIITSAAKFLD
jgi:hypothetical protein